MSAVYANLRGQSDYATLGLNVVLSILVGFGGGRWLDSYFNTAPTLAVLGFFLGVVTAGRFIFRAAKRMKRATEQDGFEESSTDRPARFKLQQKEKQGARKPRTAKRRSRGSR